MNTKTVADDLPWSVLFYATKSRAKREKFVKALKNDRFEEFPWKHELQVVRTFATKAEAAGHIHRLVTLGGRRALGMYVLAGSCE